MAPLEPGYDSAFRWLQTGRSDGAGAVDALYANRIMIEYRCAYKMRVPRQVAPLEPPITLRYRRLQTGGSAGANDHDLNSLLQTGGSAGAGERMR